MDQEPITPFRLAVLTLVAATASVLFAAAFPDAILAGDADAYRDRMERLFSGAVPYLDYPFEHLPVMILPMSLAWLLGGFVDLRSYVFAFAGVSTFWVLLTGWALRGVEQRIGPSGLTVRWLLLTVPLLPFLLFRNDSFAVLLVVTGFLMLLRGNEVAGSVSFLAGVFAKLWPGAWAPIEWWRGHRARAALLAVGGIVALSLMLSPGVQTIQDPQGLHTETLAGSMVGLIRSWQGVDLRLTSTAAVYIDAPRLGLILDLGLGLLIGAVTLARFRRQFEWRSAWMTLGALTAAVLMASPFFSTQYVSWVTPFAAAESGAAKAMLLVNLTSLFLITTWFDLFDGSLRWWSLLVARNLLFLFVAFRLARFGENRLLKEPEEQPISA